MSKERSDESFLPKNFWRTTSVLWLSLMLSTSYVCFSKRSPTVNETGYSGVDVLLGAVKNGKELKNSDFLRAIEMDAKSLFQKYGDGLDFMNVSAYSIPNGTITYLSILPYYSHAYLKNQFDSITFPIDPRYLVRVGFSTEDKKVLLTEEQQKSVSTLINKNVPGEVDCSSDIELGIYNFGPDDEEVIILKEIYLNKDSKFLADIKALSDIDLKTGQISNYWHNWEESGYYSKQIPKELDQVMKICG